MTFIVVFSLRFSLFLDKHLALELVVIISPVDLLLTNLFSTINFHFNNCFLFFQMDVNYARQEEVSDQRSSSCRIDGQSVKGKNEI